MQVFTFPGIPLFQLTWIRHVRKMNTAVVRSFVNWQVADVVSSNLYPVVVQLPVFLSCTGYKCCSVSSVSHVGLISDEVARFLL